MSENLLRIDYRMRENVFTYSQFMKEKYCRKLKRKNVIFFSLLFLFIILFVLLQIIFYQSEMMYPIPFFVGLIIEIIFIALFIFFGRKIIMHFSRQKKKKLFQDHSFEQNPCTLIFGEDKLTYHVGKKEVNITYKDINFVVEWNEGFAIIMGKCTNCISLPKEGLSEKVVDLCKDIFIDQIPEKYHNECRIDKSYSH